jgi:hypothetical protein
MIGYRCYFLSADEKIQRAEEFMCADDRAAISRARALFNAKSYPALELWRGDQKIHAETSDRADS